MSRIPASPASPRRRRDGVGRLLAGACLAAAVASPAAPSLAAGQEDAAERLARWIALDAPVGHERLATGPLRAAIPGWERDPDGNLVRIVGEGAPTRVVACGIDRPGYVVSRITDDGYLRLHRAGRGPDHPLWDQAHEGQQVTVFTEAGPVPAVTAIANAHFSYQHRRETAVTTADDLWVDAGARSRAEAVAMGIRLLDPVTRRLPPWSFGEWAAGPDAGARAGCAAVAAVAAVAENDGARGSAGDGRSAGAAGGTPVDDASPEAGRTVFLITAQRTFGWVGLGAALARLGTVASLTILEAGEGSGVDEWRAVDRFGLLAPVLEEAGLDSVRRLAPGVRHPGTLVESIAAGEAARLRRRVARAAGMPSAAEAPWPEVGGGAAGQGARGGRTADGPREPELAELAGLLARLADLPGVSGHEGRVREAVLAAMPAWARERAEVDAAGNVTVAFGPERDTTVFIAHLDEVGYQVEAIAPDGTVALRRRGGLIPRAWEGQPAVLYPGSGGTALRGTFLPRQEAEARRPARVRAWFGRDAAALAARGVAPGDQVLAYKEALRLGPTRFTARSLDDRTGTTALLVALRRVGEGSGPRDGADGGGSDAGPEEGADGRAHGKVVFAWSVEEETGLHGARALARRLRASVARVYSVDTFVSSDTPLESPHFAYAPLGEGPVLRAAESSSLTPPPGRERVWRIARDAGLPLQTGITQGGTDGTAFTFWGAPNAGLSWPGRYSHSPVEVLDLVDLADLVSLIEAVATASSGAP